MTRHGAAAHVPGGFQKWVPDSFSSYSIGSTASFWLSIAGHYDTPRARFLTRRANLRSSGNEQLSQGEFTHLSELQFLQTKQQA